MEIKAFHKLAVKTAELYAAKYLESHAGKTDEEKAKRLSTHSKLGQLGIGMYFSDSAAKQVVEGNLDEGEFFSFTAGGVEFNNSTLQIQAQFKETIFPIDIAAWLYEIKKCIEGGAAFEKQLADFKADPGETHEVEVVKTVEPEDYQACKTKAGMLDKMLGRDLHITGASAPF